MIFHSIGNVHLQNGTGFDKRGKTIAFENNTLNSNIEGLILESALYPILLPHENRAYDGRTTLSKYLKYNMSRLFFIFTIQKHLQHVVSNVRVGISCQKLIKVEKWVQHGNKKFIQKFKNYIYIYIKDLAL